MNHFTHKELVICFSYMRQLEKEAADQVKFIKTDTQAEKILQHEIFACMHRDLRKCGSLYSNMQDKGRRRLLLTV